MSDELTITILNWNIAGAKFLEMPPSDREIMRSKINEALRSLIELYKPMIITLQEVVECRYPSERNVDCTVKLVDIDQMYVFSSP